MDDVKIEVLQDGMLVRVVDLETENSIDIVAGNYEIRPMGDANSVEIKNSELTLTRGDREIVTITKSENPITKAIPAHLLPLFEGNAAWGDQPGYKVDHRDVLGIFVEYVLGKPDSDPPIHQPAPGSGLPPALGFPIQVDHKGMISLPLVEPIEVRGMTVQQIRQELFKRYTSGDQPILRESARIFVSMIQPRDYKPVAANPASRANPTDTAAPA